MKNVVYNDFFKITKQPYVDSYRYETEKYPKNPLTNKQTKLYQIKQFSKPVTCCIGIVDFVNSTNIVSRLSGDAFTQYYQIPLNELSKILRRFNSLVIKNTGDGFLFNFPFTLNLKDPKLLLQCIKCSMAMIEAQKDISKKLEEINLPQVDFRISMDFGEIFLVYVESQNDDLDMIGNVVNSCAKINSLAPNNGIIIGENLRNLLPDY